MQSRLDAASVATGAGLLALVLWSSTFALARSLTEQTGALAGAAGVYLSGGVLCLLHAARQGTLLPSLVRVPRSYLLGCGSLFAAYTVLIYVAVGASNDREQLLEIALVNYLWPSGTILLSVPLLRQRANFLLLPATLVALTGLFLVMTQGASLSWTGLAQRLRNSPAPYACALAAALAWALYSNLARLWTRPDQGGSVAWFIPATGVLLLIASTVQPTPAVWTWRAAVEALVLGIITALGYAFWDLAMRKGNLLLVAACSYATPLLSTLVSSLYLAVLPGTQLWVGAALLITGSGLSWLAVSPPAHPRELTRPPPHAQSPDDPPNTPSAPQTAKAAPPPHSTPPPRSAAEAPAPPGTHAGNREAPPPSPAHSP